MLKFFLLLFFIPITCFSQEKYTLSIAAIFQNEGEYIDEWIRYHYENGVEHFYLYNNNSTDDFHKALDPWIKKEIVELIEWPSVQQENDWQNFSFTTQTGAYNHAINKSCNVSKWLALIDIDEFIVVVDQSNIGLFLEKNYPQVSGLCVNWQCYGTSHVTKCKSVLHELVYKMRWNHDWNKHSKSIVRPTHVLKCVNPHYCLYNGNHWAIDADYGMCDQCCKKVLIDKIRLNHYWTRDEWFLWNVKIPRYEKWGVDIDGILKHAESMNDEYDGILSNSSG